LLAMPALLAFRARDPRRFVVGVVVAATIWFVLWYPNISGLPLPSSVAHVYLGLLPTYNYDFQFAVNMSEPYTGGLMQPGMVMLVMGITALALAALYSGRAIRETQSASVGGLAEDAGPDDELAEAEPVLDVDEREPTPSR